MNRYNDYWTVITIHWAEAFFLLFKLNFSWQIQPSLSFTKSKSSAVLIKLLYPSTSFGSRALVHLHVNPCTKLNKVNYKIQDYFANRQIKEDIKCNKTCITYGSIKHNNVILSLLKLRSLYRWKKLLCMSYMKKIL
jgi:hypothetical protein